MITPGANGTDLRSADSSTSAGAFKPALAFGVLTPLFDMATALLGFGGRCAEQVAGLADVRPGDSVLDLGCGTGRVLAALANRQQSARFVGVDPDPRVLAIARRRLEEVGATVELRRGYAHELAFSAGTFDLVLSTLVFHPLPDDTKRATIAEVARVLRPGGRFLLIDFSRPETVVPRTLLRLGSVFDGRANLRANLAGRLPLMLHEAGFQVAEVRPPYHAVRYLLARPLSASPTARVPPPSRTRV